MRYHFAYNSFVIFYILFTFCLQRLPAQKPDDSKMESHPEWTVFYKTNSMLPGNKITALKLDAMGNIWAAVNNQLLKYNGTEWKNYKSPGGWKSSGHIKSIATDESGKIWILHSEKGLAFLTDDEWVKYNSKNILPDITITSILPDYENNIWIGTLSHGLIKFNDMELKVYNTDSSGIHSNRIVSLATDGIGSIFASTERGMAVFDRDSIWKIYNAGALDQPINIMQPDASGTIWLGCGSASSRDNEGGLIRFSYNSVTNFTKKNTGILGNYITSIAKEDKKSTLWVTYGNIEYRDFKSGITSFEKGGIASFNGSRWKNITPLFEKFLQTLDNSLFQMYGTESSEILKRKSHNINAIIVDLNQNKWIATDHGLFVYHEKGISFDSYSSQPSY